MRLLFDNTLSWRVARDLRRDGHDTVHVADLGLASATDNDVYRLAAREKRILVTHDADFDSIHAIASSPVGVVLIRLSNGTPRVQADVLAANLPELEVALLSGAYVTITDDSIVVQGPEMG